MLKDLYVPFYVKEDLKNVLWPIVTVQKYYDCINVILLYDEKWLTVTKDSYDLLFYDTIKNKFNINDLDKDYCYYFNVIHHDHKKLVKYEFEDNVIYHIKTIEKITHKEIEYNIDNCPKLFNETFTSYNSMLNNLLLIGERDLSIHRLTMKGYIVRYDNKIVKVKTEAYKMLKNMTPPYKNTYVGYLDLYQKNKLTFYLQFFVKNWNQIVLLINNSVKNLSKELSSLYYLTRFKKNIDIHNNLSAHYKKILFNIHGIYIQRKNSTDTNNKNINQYIIYDYLKKIPLNDLILLFCEKSYDDIYITELVEHLNKN